MRSKGQWLAVVLVGLVVAGVAVLAVVGKSLASSPRGAGAAAAGSAAPTSADTSAPADPSDATTTPSDEAQSSSGASATTTASSDSTKVVHPTLVYVDWDASGRQVEASGFVSDVVEAGGTCTLTLTSGADQVQASSSAQPDATTTNCGHITVPGAQLRAGTWQATLTYRSASSHGTAAPLTVSVPAS